MTSALPTGRCCCTVCVIFNRAYEITCDSLEVTGFAFCLLGFLQGRLSVIDTGCFRLLEARLDTISRKGKSLELFSMWRKMKILPALR